MMTFWILALGLGALAFAFIGVPSYFFNRQAEQNTPEHFALHGRTDFNVSIYQERQAEYEDSLQQGRIDADEFNLLINELKRNLIQENQEDGETQPVNTSGSVRLPIVLAMFVPLFAFIAYMDNGLSWGAIDDLQLAEAIESAQHGDADSMNASIYKLAQRMQKQPDNSQGWLLLAQSYMNIKQYKKGAASYRHLLDRFPGDPNLASFYARAIYMAQGRQVTTDVKRAIDRALSLNPGDIRVLEIKAMGLHQQGDIQGSLSAFKKALAAATDVDRQRTLRHAIAKIEQDASAPGKTAAPAKVAAETQVTGVANAAGPAATQTAIAGRQLKVLVEVADPVRVSGEASVFVFARAVRGPPMPLAVKRLNRRDLPRLVLLDESMAMMQGMGLANFDEVEVVARISASGIANAGPDDYEAVSAKIDMTINNPVIKLKIETQRKNR